MKKFLIAVAIACGLVSFGQVAVASGFGDDFHRGVANRTMKMTPKTGTVKFIVGVALLPNIVGKFTRYDIKVSGSGGGVIKLTSKFDVPTADISSMRETVLSPDFFWVEKYKSVSYTSSMKKSAIKTDSKGRITAAASGKLTLRGVTRPATMRYVFDCEGVANCPRKGTRVKGKMVIKRQDFGMDAMGLVVDDEVVIEVDGVIR